MPRARTSSPQPPRRRPGYRRAQRLARTRFLPAATILALASAMPGAEAVAGFDPARTSGRNEADEVDVDAAYGPAQPLRPGDVNALVEDLAGATFDAAAITTTTRPDIDEPWAAAADGDPGDDEDAANAQAGEVPEVALRAYVRAELALGMSDPECGLHWSLLAAIGRVESDHGRFGGATLRSDGSGTRPIRGIPLDGRAGVARIGDTDGGDLDGDDTYDRAVGPMQFIPTTWERVAVDADADGERNPDNIFDAALGAAVYLCAGDTDLADEAQLRDAIRRYNPSAAYVATIVRLARSYERGEPTLPDPEVELPPVPPLDEPTLPLPPADPAPPPAYDPPPRRRPTTDTTRGPSPSTSPPRTGGPSTTPRPSPPPSPSPTRPPTTPTPTTPVPTTPVPPTTPGSPTVPPGSPTFPPGSPTAPPASPTSPPTRPPTTAPPTTPPTTPPTPPTTPPPTTPPTTPPSACAVPPAGAGPSGQLPSGPFALSVTGRADLVCLRLTLPTGLAPQVENRPELLANEWRVNSADGRHVVWGLARPDVVSVTVTVAAPDGADAGTEPDRSTVTIPTQAAGVDGVGQRAFAAALPAGGTIEAMAGWGADGRQVAHAVGVAESLAPVAGFDPSAGAYVQVVDG